jgi:hypothetical protein
MWNRYLSIEAKQMGKNRSNFQGNTLIQFAFRRRSFSFFEVDLSKLLLRVSLLKYYGLCSSAVYVLHIYLYDD